MPECLDDFIDESKPVRVVVDALDLAELGFDGIEPAATGRPSYHPVELQTERAVRNIMWELVSVGEELPELW